MRRTVEQDLLVDLVRDDEKVACLGELCDRDESSELGVSAPGRVVRVRDDEELGLAR